MKWSRNYAMLGAFSAAFYCGTLVAQDGVQRTVVQKGDVSVPGREAVTVRVEFAPAATTGRHTHPGDEIDYVIDGQGDWMIEGQPVRQAKTGDSIIIPS